MENKYVNWIKPIEVTTSPEEGEDVTWEPAMLVHPCYDDYGSDGQGGMLVVTEEGYSVHFDRWQEQLVDHHGWMIRNKPCEMPEYTSSRAASLIPSTDEIEDQISLVLREYYLLKKLLRLAEIRDNQQRDRKAIVEQSQNKIV